MRKKNAWAKKQEEKGNLGKIELKSNEKRNRRRIEDKRKIFKFFSLHSSIFGKETFLDAEICRLTRDIVKTWVSRDDYIQKLLKLRGWGMLVIDWVCEMLWQFRLECNCRLDLEMMPILGWIPGLAAISLLKRNAIVGISHLRMSRYVKFIPHYW